MTATAPLAFTMGEPAGIGGELSLKAWSMRREGDRPFFVLDDASRLAALAGKLGLNVPVRELDQPAEADKMLARLDSLCVFGCTEYRMLKAAVANYKQGKKPTN